MPGIRPGSDPALLRRVQGSNRFGSPRRSGSESDLCDSRVMSISQRDLLALFLFAWICTGACACDGPIGPLPGGRLRGEELECPADWSGYEAEHEVELEVSPDAPRSVRIWNVGQEGRLFVPGDFLTPMKRWPEQVMADPRVRIRIAGELFRCAARRIVEVGLVDSLRREAARKYALEPDGWAARSEVWWFEIVRRPVR